MRAVSCTLLALILAAPCPALQVHVREDFDGEKIDFGRGPGGEVVAEDPYEGTGKCLFKKADRNRIDFGTQWKDLIPFKDLKASFCVKLVNVQGLGQNWPTYEPRDNTYAPAIGNVIGEKLHTGWPAGPAENNQADGEWGTVTLDLSGNRFNGTHAQINPDIHKCRAVSFHGAADDTGKEASVSIDNFVLYAGTDETPPAAVADLASTAEEGRVRLRWSRPDDDLFAVKYDIYRAASQDVALAKDNLVAATNRLEFADDSIVSPGTYYYRVVARDFAGNASQASNTVKIVLDDDGKAVSAEEQK
ncbi:MAG: hypothetical protein JW909_07020 [Planctomycetes bacterium]|nr:hypothetical protein [Planctomycetota bacterium]